MIEKRRLGDGSLAIQKWANGKEPRGEKEEGKEEEEGK